MYNSGGAIEGLDCNGAGDSSACMVKVQVQGCGRFGAYSNKKPRFCSVDAKEQYFNYNAMANNDLLIITLHGECSLREIEILY